MIHNRMIVVLFVAAILAFFPVRFAHAAPSQQADGPSEPFRSSGHMFDDVDRNHWAYQAFTQLREMGYLNYPQTYFDGRRRRLTRYELAVALDRVLFTLPVPGRTQKEGRRPRWISPEADAILQRLVDEFQAELKALGSSQREIYMITAMVESSKSGGMTVPLVNIPDPALITAVKNGESLKVQVLLALGVDVNARDNEGYTALMWAKKTGRARIIRLLKEAGAKEENAVRWNTRSLDP